LKIVDIEMPNGQKAHIECLRYSVKDREIKLSTILKYVVTFPDGSPVKELHFLPNDIFTIQLGRDRKFKSVKIMHYDSDTSQPQPVVTAKQ
jgi:hypothetical protein